MNNFIQEGKVLHVNVTASAFNNVKSGDLVAVGDVAGVAVTDAVVGRPLALHVTGVYKVPKPTTFAVSQGQSLYYASGVLDGGGTGKFVGYAWEAAAATDTTVLLRLRY